MQLSKQEKVGMNEAGPVTDLAACEDAIRTVVQKRSFSQRMPKFVDIYFKPAHYFMMSCYFIGHNQDC